MCHILVWLIDVNKVPWNVRLMLVKRRAPFSPGVHQNVAGSHPYKLRVVARLFCEDAHQKDKDMS